MPLNKSRMPDTTQNKYFVQIPTLSAQLCNIQICINEILSLTNSLFYWQYANHCSNAEYNTVESKLRMATKYKKMNILNKWISNEQPS